jgi:hypothetical protein
MLSLQENTHAGIHIWLPKVNLQIQMDVDVEIKTGEITSPYLNNVPTNSRTAYGTIPSPGSVIESSIWLFSLSHCLITKVRAFGKPSVFDVIKGGCRAGDFLSAFPRDICTQAKSKKSSNL